MPFRNTALRFRFTMMQQRYNTYQTYWMRTCRQIEEGTYRRHVQRMRAKESELLANVERQKRPKRSRSVSLEDFELVEDEADPLSPRLSHRRGVPRGSLRGASHPRATRLILAQQPRACRLSRRTPSRSTCARAVPRKHRRPRHRTSQIVQRFAQRSPRQKAQARPHRRRPHRRRLHRRRPRRRWNPAGNSRPRDRVVGKNSDRAPRPRRSPRLPSSRYDRECRSIRRRARRRRFRPFEFPKRSRPPRSLRHGRNLCTRHTKTLLEQCAGVLVARAVCVVSAPKMLQ